MRWDILEPTGSVVRDWDVEGDVEPSDYPEYLSPIPESTPAWMPYTRRISRNYRRRKMMTRRGRFARRRGARNLRATVTKVLMKKAETKRYGFAEENVQLYHNTGPITAALAPQTFLVFFNVWADIDKGTTHYQRIGDRITPRGMSLKIWMANKLDRPNVMYRLIIARVPKTVAGAITTNTFVNFWDDTQLGAVGNKMLLKADSDRGIKFLYDRTFNLQVGNSTNGTVQKEAHMLKKLWIRSKKGRDVVYDSSGANVIVNNPIVMTLIPYDSYGTLTTDNIASCAYQGYIYYKDV